MNQHKHAQGLQLTRRGVMQTGLAALGGAAGLGAVAACSDGADSQDGEIRIVVAGSNDDAPLWEELIGKFNEQFPDISARPEFLTAPAGSDPWTGFFSTVQTRIAGGEKYDIVYIPTEGQLLFSSRGLIEPLDSFVEEDQATVDEFESDVEPNIIDQFYAHAPEDGSRYFVPLGYNDVAIMYRKATFEEAGVELPVSGWTWDEFRAKAEELKAAGVQYPMRFGTNLFDMMPWLLTNGTAVLTDDWTASRLNEPAAEEAVRFIAGFVADGLAPVPGGQFNANAAMERGELAMTFGARGDVLGLRDRGVTESDYGYVQIPSNAASGTSIGIGAFGMFADSQQKDACWSFLRFVMSQEFQDYIAEKVLMGVSPIRTSSATSDAMLQNSPDNTLELFEATKTAVLVPGVVNQAAVADPFDRTMTQMLAGTLDPAEGLATLHQQITEALA